MPSTAGPTTLPQPSLLGDAQVPVEQEVLSLGIADYAFTVPTELRVVRWNQLQASLHPVPETLDHCSVAEVALQVPVGSDRAEVDDADMTAGRFLGKLGFGQRHGRRT